MEPKSNPNSEEQARNWLELPADITSMILMKLGAVDILSNAQIVCSLWRKICNDPLMWRVVDMQNLDESDIDYDLDLEKMCMQAVYRSCGQLVDIRIERFGSDELLQYIAQSSNQLRRLGLIYCDDISGKGLTEAVSKLPLLEDLEIFFGFSSFGVETLKTVGRSCPLLKSLKLNHRLFRGLLMKCDEEALAIAENMPNLHHLQIFGNRVTDRGLQAILDGCPHLESLDLRHCFNLNLWGQLGKKCAERIRSLRLPQDPTDDFCFFDTVDDVDYFESLLGSDLSD